MSGTGSPSALHVKKTVPPNVTSTSCGSSVICGFSEEMKYHFTFLNNWMKATSRQIDRQIDIEREGGKREKFEG